MNGKDIIRFGKKYSPLILSGIGIGSPVAATILAGKAERSLPKNASRKERAKAYRWAILAETVAVVSLSAGTVIGWKRASELTKIASSNTGRLAKLAGTTAAGIGAERIAVGQARNREKEEQKELWYDVDMDYFFEATEKDILWAMYYGLGIFVEHGELAVESLYNSIGAPYPPDCHGMGWYADDEWLNDWESWVLPFHYDTEPITDEDGRSYRRFYADVPPRFYEDLYYERITQ